MRSVSIRAAGLASAVCLLLAIGGTVMAQPAGPYTRSVRVSLKGIDLGLPEGRETARQRIAFAVHQACNASDTTGLDASADYARCQVAASGAAASRLQALATHAEQAKALPPTRPGRRHQTPIL